MRSGELNVSLVSASISADRRILVEDLNLECGRREILGLTGKSGIGKTSLLRCIANGADNPNYLRSGEWNVYAEQIIYVPQRNGLPAALRLRDLAAELVPSMSPNRSLGQAFTLLDLSIIWDKSPTQVSGGEAQRAALYLALAGRPDLLLLDEPVSAVDLPSRYRAIEAIEVAHAARIFGGAIVISHEIDTLLALCDRVAILAGTPAKIAFEMTVPMSRPRNLGMLKSDEFRRSEEQLREAVISAIGISAAKSRRV